MAKKPEKNPLDMDETPVSEVEIDKKWTPEQESAFLKMVRENAVYGQSGWSDNFKKSKEELTFLMGGENQWPDYAREARNAEGRPMLTFNDLPQYLDQVANDQRMNRPSIKVSPADDAGAGIQIGSLDGQKTYKAAEVFEGLIRNIEQQSQADSHYDTAHQHAVEAGFGWLRVVTTYAKPHSFDLDIRIKSLRNRTAVIIDPDFEEPDASDMNWAFVFDEMLRTTFDKLYPDAAIGDLGNLPAIWGGKDKVAVAEYFERHAKRRKLIMLSTGETSWEDEIKDVLDELRAKGVTVIRERMVDTYVVRWWKLTANAILRGPVEFPCSTIPIVPVFGKELNIEGKSDYRGMIRHAMDPKRADNFWMTAATERVALAPNAPWLVTPKMIEGAEGQWATANKGTPAYLTYTPDPQAPGGRPVREQGALMPVAELQMAAAMTDKVKATIGMYSAAVGAQSNETSGKAILARQHESDVGSFTYIDNLTRAIRRIGLILVEMIPRVYDGERVVRILHQDGKGDNVKLNTTVTDEQTGKPIVVNDLSLGSFDVVVKTGPAYSTLRQEAAEALMEFMRVAPNFGALIVDKIANVMDWPGADEIRKRALYTIPRHMLTKEELEEVGETPEAPPTPEQQATMAKAEATIAQADASKAMAEAKTREAEVKMAEIEAGARDNQFMEQVRALIQETMAEVLQGAARSTTEATEGAE